jgi:hypothetical protein
MPERKHAGLEAAKTGNFPPIFIDILRKTRKILGIAAVICESIYINQKGAEDA